MATRHTPNFDLEVWDALTDKVTRDQWTRNFDRIDELALTVERAGQLIENALADARATPQNFDDLTVDGFALVDTGTDQNVGGHKTFTGGVDLPDGTVGLGEADGTTLGGPAALIGFYGQTPTGQAPPYSTTGEAADRTLAAYASTPAAAPYTATPATLGDAATLADLNTLRAAYEAQRAASADLRALVVALVTDLRTLGLVG